MAIGVAAATGQVDLEDLAVALAASGEEEGLVASGEEAAAGVGARAIGRTANVLF